MALLRAAASKAGISDISQRGDAVKFTVARFDVGAIGRVCSGPKYRQRLQLAAGDTPSLTLRLRPKEQVLAAALELVEGPGAGRRARRGKLRLSRRLCRDMIDKV